MLVSGGWLPVTLLRLSGYGGQAGHWFSMLDTAQSVFYGALLF